MSSISETIKILNNELPSDVKLVAVSKFHTVDAIAQAYEAGQRVFAESRPQEFMEKVPQLPSDISWHFIGHLQTNKLKMVLPYADLIHSIDSVHLLEEVNKWCLANGKVQNVLLEYHLGAEQTKGGLTEEELFSIMKNASQYPGIRFCGMMGMATFTDDEAVIADDFRRIADINSRLKAAYPEVESFKELSIGMSDDYKIALGFGSTMVRIGTMIFGPRQY